MSHKRDELPDAAASTLTQYARTGYLINARYRLEKLIGEGAMGIVYEAVNVNVGKRVAIKALRREFTDRPDVVQRFRTEAKVAAGLKHPSIVEVDDLIEEKDVLFIVYEFLQGEDLATMVEQKTGGTLSETRMLEILEAVLGGLAKAHEAGVVHRDMKPENVFCADDGSGKMVYKILDFGIAKILDSSGLATDEQTRAGTVMGTPPYMSPEQLLDTAAAGPETDIWAVGVMTYALQIGDLPFKANVAPSSPSYPGMLAIQIKQGKGNMEKLGQLSQFMQSFVSACLSVEREGRPTALQALEMIRARRKAVGTHATQLNVAPPPPDTEAPPQPPSPPRTPAQPRAGTNLSWSGNGDKGGRRPVKWIVAGGGLAVLVAALGLLALVLMRQPTPRPHPTVLDARPPEPTPVLMTERDAGARDAGPPSVVPIQPPPGQTVADAGASSYIRYSCGQGTTLERRRGHYRCCFDPGMGAAKHCEAAIQSRVNR